MEMVTIITFVTGMDKACQQHQRRCQCEQGCASYALSHEHMTTRSDITSVRRLRASTNQYNNFRILIPYLTLKQTLLNP